MTTLDPGTDAVSQTEVSADRPAVKNPDKLLELYEQQKAELKELKAFKTVKEQEDAQREQERLKREQQYEALIPVKVREAITPLEKQIAKLEKERDEALNRANSTLSEFEKLKVEVKTSRTKDRLYEAFTQLEDHVPTPKDALWKLYGDRVKADDEGTPDEENLKILFESLKSDSLGSRLFKAKVPSGSGTTSQPGKASSSTPPKPREVTKAQLLNPKKHGFTMDDIISGKVVVAQE